MKALLIGPLATKNEIQVLLKKEPELKKSIVAVDAGLFICEKLNLTPLFAVGDFDSYREFKNKNSLKKKDKLGIDKFFIQKSEVPIWKLPVNKDRSDLSYALKLLLTQSFLSCIAIGFQGGRFDHEVGTHLDFCEASREYLSVLSTGIRGEIYYLHEKSELKLKLIKGRTLSLFPIECESVKIKCFGFKYGSFKKSFSLTRTKGLSNEATHEFQKIWCVKGSMMVMVPSLKQKGKQL